MAILPKSGITNGGTIQASHITNIVESLDGTGSYTIAATGSFTGSLVGSLTGTGSYANQALSSSYTLTASLSANATSASFATTASLSANATSASFATTASYVANASSFPFTGSAIISGSLIVTGSITTSVGFTGSLNGTASYASSSRALEVVRTAAEATYYPLMVDSSNGTTASELVYSAQNFSVKASTSGVTATSFTGSFLGTDKNAIINLSIVGVAGNGRFVIPTGQSAAPVAGTMYWDDSFNRLYVYSGTSAMWIAIN
jgi:hypothetical protein